MMRNWFRFVIVLSISVVILGAAVTLGAQDEWPEGCEVPDLEAVMSAANEAQAAGDEVAFLDALYDTIDTARTAYFSCLRGVDVQAITNADQLYFKDANLQGADLRDIIAQLAAFSGANLQGADLRNADLQGAYFIASNLQGANFSRASLQEATFRDANLQGANLRDANLQGAFCTSANLGGTDLQGANLQETRLGDARLDAHTVLPDGSNWAPDTDLARFTDPEHPAFWRGFGLSGEDLHGADFSNANLRGANMSRANFAGVNFQGANLIGARLGGATFDGDTTLPDGTSWTADTDMAHFTNPEHADFWDPCVELSSVPSYCAEGN
jgi:uncharacterized protein YjbI with pentapeptide repeats